MREGKGGGGERRQGREEGQGSDEAAESILESIFDLPSSCAAHLSYIYNNVHQTSHSPTGHASSMPHYGIGCLEIVRATPDRRQVQARRLSLEDKER
jgi:hypothetical protein